MYLSDVIAQRSNCLEIVRGNGRNVTLHEAAAEGEGKDNQVNCSSCWRRRLRGGHRDLPVLGTLLDLSNSRPAMEPTWGKCYNFAAGESVTILQWWKWVRGR